MTAKEFLNQPRVLEDSIRMKQNRLAQLKELSTKTTSVFSDMPRPETPDPQRKEKVMAEIVDTEREIEADLQTLTSSRENIVNAIANIQDPTQMQVLIKRYLDCKTWSQIFTEMGVCESVARRAHQAALDEVEKIV